MHSLLWVNGAPCIYVDNDEEVCSFIDTYVCGMIPDSSHDNKHTAKMVKNIRHMYIQVIVDEIDVILVSKVSFTMHNYMQRTRR